MKNFFESSKEHPPPRTRREGRVSTEARYALIWASRSRGRGAAPSCSTFQTANYPRRVMRVCFDLERAARTASNNGTIRNGAASGFAQLNFRALLLSGPGEKLYSGVPGSIWHGGCITGGN